MNHVGKLQHLEGLMRRAIQSYQMIEPGDKICIGVSGGKDSVALTLALHRLAAYFEHPYTIHALTLDPCFNGAETDYSRLEEYFAWAGIPYTIERTDIGSLVFDKRCEKNPCALCAKLRRGILHTQAKKLGCNKVALGHHLDDAVETFYMNLFGEGRIGCFSPVTWLSEKEITMIRPLVFAREADVVRAVAQSGLPVVKSRCPVDGQTARAQCKAFVAQRSREDAAFCQKTLGAMQKAGINGWAPYPLPRKKRKQADTTLPEDE